MGYPRAGWKLLGSVKQSRGGIRGSKSSLLGVEILVQVDRVDHRLPARLFGLEVADAIFLIVRHDVYRGVDDQISNADTQKLENSAGRSKLAQSSCL